MHAGVDTSLRKFSLQAAEQESAAPPLVASAPHPGGKAWVHAYSPVRS